MIQTGKNGNVCHCQQWVSIVAAGNCSKNCDSLISACFMAGLKSFNAYRTYKSSSCILKLALLYTKQLHVIAKVHGGANSRRCVNVGKK